VEFLGISELADRASRPALVDLTAPSTERQLRDALAAAMNADVPLVGLHPGALPPRLEALAAALTATLVHVETTMATAAVPDLAAANDAIRSLVTNNPTAAATLVGLLRSTSQLPVADGLVCESLAYSMLLGGPEFAAWRTATPRRAPRHEDGPFVRIERDDDLLTVALHRPRKHNAFSRDVRDALIEALQIAELDPSVAVDLRGDGPSFCSGGDLDEFGTARDLAAAHLIRITQNAGACVHRLRDRMTAYLHGSCIGAGIEVAAFAGRVKALPDTKIQLPELRMGLVPGAGGTVSLTHRIGRWRTAYLILSGATIDVDIARRWGLVDDVSES
jgi:hypothetical protein